MHIIFEYLANFMYEFRIIPQAVCSRHGLRIGANLAWFVKILIFLMYFIAYPISKLLDWMLGEHHGTLYRRTGKYSCLPL